MQSKELEYSDRKMVQRWQMTTEFMLQRLEPSTIKRLVDDIRDGIKYRVDEDGNIVEESFTPIERDKEELGEKIVEKLEKEKKTRERIEDKISRLESKTGLPGSNQDEEIKSKIEVLEEVLEE